MGREAEAKCQAEGEKLCTKSKILQLLQVRVNLVRRRGVRDKEESENMGKIKFPYG